MNHMKTLSGVNFKGRTFAHELAPITLFVGRNRVGKTARLEAAQLALLGYMPNEPKPIKAPRDLFDMFATTGSTNMAVEMGGNRREWRMAGGSVKYTGPDVPAIPPASLDPSSYLGMSGPERLAFMFRVTGAAAGLVPAGVAAQVIATAKNTIFESNTPDTELA